MGKAGYVRMSTRRMAVEDLQCGGEVVWQATKEKEEKDDPFEVVDQCVSNGIGIQTILKYCRGHVRQPGEDDNT